MERALRNRLIFGTLLLAGLAALLWLDHAIEAWTIDWMLRQQGTPWGVGGVGLLVLMLMLMPPAVVELAHLFAARQVRPYMFIAGAGCASLGIHAFLTQFRWFQPIAASTLCFIVVSVMLSAALRRAWVRQTAEAIGHMAGTVLATLYFGGLLWFLIALRVKHSASPDGFHGTTWVIVMILLVAKFTDIGAFFGGKLLGRHKLIPWLSPKKTWEGFFCGLLFAAAVGAACAPRVTNLDVWKAIVFGIVIGAVGQLGDLLESLMKRDADVKDSGRLIPGFGGVLDVTDSPLLAAPFAYLLFSLF